MTKYDLRAMSVGFLIGLSFCIGAGGGIWVLSNFLPVPRIIATVVILMILAAIGFVYFIPTETPVQQRQTLRQVSLNFLKGLGAIIGVLLVVLFLNMMINYIIRWCVSGL